MYSLKKKNSEKKIYFQHPLLHSLVYSFLMHLPNVSRIKYEILTIQQSMIILKISFMGKYEIRFELNLAYYTYRLPSSNFHILKLFISKKFFLLKCTKQRCLRIFHCGKLIKSLILFLEYILNY